jgi:hypothetical protein
VSHWTKPGHELLINKITERQSFSPLTLAMLQDLGWYYATPAALRNDQKQGEGAAKRETRHWKAA